MPLLLLTLPLFMRYLLRLPILLELLPPALRHIFSALQFRRHPIRIPLCKLIRLKHILRLDPSLLR